MPSQKSMQQKGIAKQEDYFKLLLQKIFLREISRKLYIGTLITLVLK